MPGPDYLRKEAKRINEDYEHNKSLNAFRYENGNPIPYSAFRNADDAQKEAEKKIQIEKLDAGHMQRAVFLWNERKGEESGNHLIQRHITKYQALSDRHNEGLVNYANRFGNHSAWKRSRSASDAKDYYIEYERSIQNLLRRKGSIDAIGQVNTRNAQNLIKSFYRDSIKALTIRQEAMLAAAEVKSTSDADEDFRKVKVRRQMLAQMIRLTERYIERYADGDLFIYFSNKKIALSAKLDGIAGEYKEKYLAARGYADPALEVADSGQSKPYVVNQPFVQIKLNRVQRRDADGDMEEVEEALREDLGNFKWQRDANPKIQSVRGALNRLNAQNHKYGDQLGKLYDTYRNDRDYDGYNPRDREHAKTLHHRMGHAYDARGEIVLRFNVHGTGDNLVEHGNSHYRYGNEMQDRPGVKVRRGGAHHAHPTDNRSLISIKGCDEVFGGGRYSIDASAETMRQLAIEKLQPLFSSWRQQEKDGQEPHFQTIHFMMDGLSRGAVSTMLGAMSINGWVAEFYPQYAKYVKYDVIQRDPVPGPSTATEKGQVKIGGAIEGQKLDTNGFIKGTKYKPLPSSATNSTVFYCLHPSVPLAAFFQPQCIYGANRIILSPFKHTDNGNDIGAFEEKGLTVNGQIRDRGSKTAHRQMFNNENGEFYSGSGVSDLADGVYILDEHSTLTRLKSYEDAEYLLNQTRKDIIPSRRKSRLLDVLREWFAAHPEQAQDEAHGEDRIG